MDIDERLGHVPLVAILRAPDASGFLPVVEVLYDSGFRGVEVTLTTAGAWQCIQDLRSSMPPDLLVGAGSLRRARDLVSASEAGAQFFVSQFASSELRDAAAGLGLDYIPGALTPTEVNACRTGGAVIIKVSPVGPIGGVAYVRELVAPMPDARLFVTGGVCVQDVVGYLDAGAAVVGLSRDLLGDALLPGADLEGLGIRAERVVQAVAVRSLASSSHRVEAAR
jgi:2-dehydro-3-deoxyphosphogluconate aldolase/(4S)-4-hydroxy-2-oxoglutarate aldolase